MKVNGEWSLDALYAGYEDEKLKNDVTNLDEACARIGDLAKTIASLPDAEALRAYVGAAEAYTRYITDLSLFSELKSSTNTRDMQSASFSGQIMAKASAVAGDFAAIEAHIAKIDGLDDIVSSDEELREYAYLFHCLKEDSRYLMSPKEEEILARMNTSGARAWSDLQAFLTSF